jgi:hypothetical protein
MEVRALSLKLAYFFSAEIVWLCYEGNIPYLFVLILHHYIKKRHLDETWAKNKNLVGLAFVFSVPFFFLHRSQKTFAKDIRWLSVLCVILCIYMPSICRAYTHPPCFFNRAAFGKINMYVLRELAILYDFFFLYLCIRSNI